MNECKKTGFRIGIDGWFLLVCAIVFVCGLIPQTRDAIMWTVTPIVWLIDMRDWSRTTWIFFNLLVVLILIGVRVGPDLWSDFCERQQQKAKERGKASKAQILKEQRKTMERMQESRRRRKF